MYLQVAASIYKGNTLSDGIPLIDLFLNIFQKAKGQAHVAQAVTESLTAGIVLEKFAALDDDAISQKLQPVFSLSLDNEKQFFTSDKFLTSATQFGYEQLIVFTNLLFANHSRLFCEKTSRPWYRSIASILVHSTWKIRSAGKGLLKSVAIAGHAMPLAIQSNILQDLKDLMNSQKTNAVVQDELAPGTEKSLRHIPAKIFMEAFEAIVFALDDISEEDKEKLCLLTFIDANHPILSSLDQNLWRRILTSFDVDIPEFLQRNKEVLTSMVLDAEVFSTAMQSGICTLLELGFDIFLSDMVGKCINVFQDPQLKNFTNNDYGIMLTA